MFDEDKMMRASDSELAEDCERIRPELNRKFRAKFGVAPSERLMLVISCVDYGLPGADHDTPEEEAAYVARRLAQPVVVVDIDEGLLAFARPSMAS